MKSVLLTVDALRVDHLSQYGYDRETMPALDRLTSEGFRFESGFANGTNTGVSLPSLLTSQYFGSESVANGPNIATALQDAGTTTAGFHSNTLFANRVDGVAGFDYYEDYDSAEGADESSSDLSERMYQTLVDTLRPIVEQLRVRDYAETVQEFVFPTSLVHNPSVYVDAETLTNDVLSWVETHADEDFFVWVHYMDPHRPYGIDVEEPAFGNPADEPEIRDLMSKAGIHPEDITPTERQRMIDLYDSDIRYTSTHVSRLFDGLADLGIWEETCVAFTADHGEEFGDHGYYYHRNRPFDELLHVPLAIKPPDGDTGAVIEQQRELLDIAPTICTWHGVEPPTAFRGNPLFEGEGRKVVATGSFVESDHVVAGRWNGWKYMSVGDETVLFDLDDDPSETRNVAGAHPEVVDEFEGLIPEYVFQGDPVSVTTENEPEEVKQRLSDLGYLE